MEKVKILFLAANPSRDLRLDEEIREITAQIRSTEYRDALDLVSCWAVRPDDLRHALLQHRPHVLHFSGHGSPSDEIILLDDRSNPYPVPRQALVALLRTLKDNLELVVLNACYSLPQAEVITEVVGCTIAMDKAIDDKAAIKFAAAFYHGLGFGRSVQTAFELGLNSLALMDAGKEQRPQKPDRKLILGGGGMARPNSNDQVPQLIVRQGVDASRLFLAGRNQADDDGPEHAGGDQVHATLQVAEAQQSVRLIRIFVSSPGDVQEERDVLDEVVTRINRTDGQRQEVRLEIWDWQDAVPQIGPKPQDVIDAQTPSYDIYLGIMAHRFGTPTGRYGSGTEKEFKDALKKWGKVGKPWILFYFNEAAVNPTTLDLEQYTKVCKFREQVQKKGLYAKYDGVRGADTAFFEQVDDHLRKVIPRLLQPVAAPKPRSQPTPAGKKQPAKPTIPQAYLDWLQRQCADIDLLGLELKEGRSLKLNHVYVPVTTQPHTELDTDGDDKREPRTQQEKPHLLLDLLNKQSLYVSGDPGSGKSTFCRWAAWLACTGSMPERVPPEPEDYRESIPDSFEHRLPILVKLREFWEYLPHDAGDRLTLDRFQEALSAWLTKTKPAGLSWANLLGHVQQGTALLIFDGVDEVPVSATNATKAWNPRSLLISGLTEAMSTWEKLGNRMLLTSRPYGVRETDRQRLELPHAPLQPLARPLQDLLVRRWFCILREDEAEGAKLATDMFNDLRGRADVDELSANPMLLTAMCIIYNDGKRLPQDRCDLYAKIVEYVLYNRFKVPTQIEKVRNELCVVAHAMHAGLGDDRSTPRAKAKHDEIDRALEAYREQRRYTQSGFEDLLHRREQLLSQTGLLVPRGDDEAEFYHLSIQEFLAAQRLWAVANDQIAEVFVRRAEVPEWRNTLAFLFGTQLSKIAAPEPSIRLLERLINECSSDQLGLQIVLGDCLQILLGKDIRLKQDQEGRYREMCVDAIEREVPLRERNLLGLALGHVGDPRIVTDLREEAGYVEIPAGKYAYQDEKQQIKRPFLLSRYPVTNSQYAFFIKEQGYEQRKWWSTEGWKWREGNNRTEPDYWQNVRRNAPNQPVVGVTFWEAEAFCKWTGGELPSENQWEAAARGSEGRYYPWGNAWEDGICNSREAKLGVTSPVGLFPRSRSLELGLEDMAGNVWEWCRDKYSPDSSSRVLRGGSFSTETDYCRSAFRFSGQPVNRADDFGFRVSRTYS